jgi:hypothetical protein
LPVSFLKDLVERITSPIRSIQEAAAAEVRTVIEKSAAGQKSRVSEQVVNQMVRISADGLVVAAQQKASEKSSSNEVEKTHATLEKVKNDLPADTKKYVEEKIQEARSAETQSNATPTPEQSVAPQNPEQINLPDAPKGDVEIKEQAASTAAEFSKAAVDQVVKKQIDSAASGVTAAPNDRSPVSTADINQATAPLNELVKTVNDLARNNPADSKSSKGADVVNGTVINRVVPESPSDSSGRQPGTEKDVSGANNTTPTQPSMPALDATKTRTAKTKPPLDDAKSKRLEAELLLAISVIERVAKDSGNRTLPYSQLRELRLRLDNQKNGDLRNLAEPNKKRVLAKLNALDKRLRKQGGKHASDKKNFPETSLLRVGFLFPNEAQRLSIRLAQVDLNRNAGTPFYCPAIENVGKKGNIPQVTEVRYFEYSIFGWLQREDAESHAARLAELLHKIPGIGTVRTVYYKPEREDEKPGNFEIWFSQKAFH